MTETRKAWTACLTNEQMIEYYTKNYQNMLSSAAEARMNDLELEASIRGLRFEMTNRTQYMMPHFVGAPRFELVEK